MLGRVIEARLAYQNALDMLERSLRDEAAARAGRLDSYHLRAAADVARELGAEVAPRDRLDLIEEAIARIENHAAPHRAESICVVCMLEHDACACAKVRTA